MCIRNDQAVPPYPPSAKDEEWMAVKFFTQMKVSSMSTDVALQHLAPLSQVVVDRDGQQSNRIA